MKAPGTPSGAIAHHHGVAFRDRLEPEEIAADDVARLPNKEMVRRHRFEFPPSRQHSRLDAARVTQALQDELIGGRGPLLLSFTSVRSL
jgi:hypothetical protein